MQLCMFNDIVLSILKGQSLEVTPCKKVIRSYYERLTDAIEHWRCHPIIATAPADTWSITRSFILFRYIWMHSAKISKSRDCKIILTELLFRTSRASTIHGLSSKLLGNCWNLTQIRRWSQCNRFLSSFTVVGVGHGAQYQSLRGSRR